MCAKRSRSTAHLITRGRFCFHWRQCVNLAQNDIVDASSLVALAFLPDIQWVNIRGNNLSAVDVQTVRDAFSGKPHVTLLS